jgi:hypothetical protein
MTADAPRRTLIVANLTASTPALLAEVKRRAAGGETFALMVPPEKGDHAHDWTLEDATRMVEEACQSDVQTFDCGSDAAARIKSLVEEQQFAGIVVSTAPEHLARWVHHDLPHRIEHLGLPVMVIPPERDGLEKPIDGLPAEWIAEHPLAGTGGY